jgi:hypothetical protein
MAWTIQLDRAYLEVNDFRYVFQKIFIFHTIYHLRLISSLSIFSHLCSYRWFDILLLDFLFQFNY